MSCKYEIHEDDIGTEFIVIINKCEDGVESPLDISSATLLQVIIKRSDDTTVTGAASFTSVASGGTADGSDGKISYFTVTGDLTPTGTYKIQGIVTTPVGKWSSEVDHFKVKDNLL